MDVPRARQIDELYEAGKDHDLILTTEAPLADALNARIDQPQLGQFAITPRRLVRSQQQNEELLERRDLFLAVVQQTDLDWKQAVFLLDNVISCWEHEGSPDAILAYERFDNDAVRQVIDVIRSTDNLFSAMANHEIDPTQDVAVIGEHQFTALDKAMLPEDHDVIPVHSEDTENTLAPFKIHRSASQIVQSISNVVTPSNADDIAIVINPDSSYRAMIEARLQADDIPYMVEQTLDEAEELRTVIALLRAALDRDQLRIKDVRALLPLFDLSIPLEYNDQVLSAVDHEAANSLQELLDAIAAGTFGDVLSHVQDNSDNHLRPVRELFTDLSLLDEAVTEERINHLEYFLAAFDERVDRSRRGVLLASATSAAYVDRPIVFYVGIDAGWTHDPSVKPWIDREEQEYRRTTDFSLLLQNGEQQHYLVQDRELNTDIIPCFYFSEFVDDEITSFRDEVFDPQWYTVSPADGPYGFDTEDYPVTIEEEVTLSQTRLNRLVRCPRDYYFDQLVPSIDREHLTKGDLFHDFAEFYVNHPDIVEEAGLDTLVELMVARLRPFVDPTKIELRRTEFRVGCQTIKSFIDREGVETADLESYEQSRYGNLFADHFDVDMDTAVTEMRFENEALGARGEVDLLLTPTHLVDHKSSGSIPSQRSIVTQGHPDQFDDDPDFQAILYLAHHRSEMSQDVLRFSFFHFLNNEGDVVTGDDRLDDNIVTVPYYPRTFDEQLLRQSTYDFLHSANVRRNLLDPLGPDTYRDIMMALDVPEDARWDKDALEEAALDEFMEQCRPHLDIGRGQDVTENQLEKGCRSVLRKLVGFRENHFFEDDLDQFESFLQKQIAALNEYKHGTFPVGDTDLDNVDHRDLIIQ